MISNEQLINQFYTAFQNKDYTVMQACYADHAKFSDPVFVDLNAGEVRAMWEMLCKNGKDLKLTFDQVQVNGNIVTANWTAIYTFSKTGKKVKNKINASFTIENGLIVSHKDQFDLYAWGRQAFGFTGWIIGWTDVFRNKIQETAMKNLAKFMTQNGKNG
jgi:ketosteroid isomerase-like protein